MKKVANITITIVHVHVALTLTYLETRPFALRGMARGFFWHVMANLVLPKFGPRTIFVLQKMVLPCIFWSYPRLGLIFAARNINGLGPFLAAKISSRNFLV